LNFDFGIASGTLERGVVHTIEIGEEQLAQSLFERFWDLTDEVLALGDTTMFLRGRSVRHNIYKVLRLRTNRADAKQKTDEVISMFGLNPKTKVKKLSEGELLSLALARSYFRTPELVVIKKFGGYLERLDVDTKKWSESFVVVIT